MAESENSELFLRNKYMGMIGLFQKFCLFMIHECLMSSATLNSMCRYKSIQLFYKKVNRPFCLIYLNSEECCLDSKCTFGLSHYRETAVIECILVPKEHLLSNSICVKEG